MNGKWFDYLFCSDQLSTFHRLICYWQIRVTVTIISISFDSFASLTGINNQLGHAYSFNYRAVLPTYDCLQPHVTWYKQCRLTGKAFFHNRKRKTACLGATKCMGTYGLLHWQSSGENDVRVSNIQWGKKWGLFVAVYALFINPLDEFLPYILPVT